MAHLIHQQFGNYCLNRLIGEGGFAQVYSGEHVHLHTQAAVKVLHRHITHDSLEKFLFEARLAAHLIHPHIIRVLEFGREDNIPFLVMDYAPKGTLRQLHPKGTQLPLTTVISYVNQLVSAIEYAHQQKVVHRDIKPENMLLGQNNEILLSDFGIAVVAHNKSSLITQEMAGTILYMAPEQIQGKPQPASDQYALAIVVYEWLCGAQPFQGTLAEILYKHLSVPPPPLHEKISTLPLSVEEVVLKALTKDPKNRFNSMQAFASALENACFAALNWSLVSASSPVLMKQLPHANISSGNTTISPPPTLAKRPVSAFNGPDLSFQSAALSLPPIVKVRQPDTSLNKATDMLLRPPPRPTFSSSSFPLKKRKKQSYFIRIPHIIIGTVLLLLIIAGSVTKATLFLEHKKQLIASSTVGLVSFQDDAFGHSDVLNLQMQQLPPPPSGKNYDVWIKEEPNRIFLLGPLTLQNRSASFFYIGNTTHSNLVSIIQSVFVTLENTAYIGTTPQGPTMYQAQFDVTLRPYIEDILSSTPGLPAHISVATSLLESIRSINDFSDDLVSALQETHDYSLALRQATRIMEIIDGTSYARNIGDLPASYPSFLNRPVGLLSSPAQPGYIDLLANQIGTLQQKVSRNSTYSQHLQSIRNAIANLRGWSQKMRLYDFILLKSSNLSDPASINEALLLKNAATYSYLGRNDPSNKQLQFTLGFAGASQAYSESQSLAALDVKHL